MSITDNKKGNTPVTLAEFDLRGGVNGEQTFYDLSLVDGYNLPIGLTYIPGMCGARSSNLQLLTTVQVEILVWKTSHLTSPMQPA
jgi:hypothetical protein